MVARLKRALSDAHPASLDCFGDPATDEQIAELESRFGYELPGQLKAFLKIHGPPDKRTADGLAGSNWHFYEIDSIYKRSMETTHRTPWGTPEGGMPCAPDWYYGWAPGVVEIMSDDYEFLGIYIEDGKVYELDPESGYVEQATSLVDWFNNISDRLENGQYSKNGGDFELTPPSGKYMSTPGIRTFSFRFHISSPDVPWFLPATDADAIPVLMQSTGKKFDELFEPLADQKFRIKPAAEPLFNLKK